MQAIFFRSNLVYTDSQMRDCYINEVCNEALDICGIVMREGNTLQVKEQ